MKKSKKDKDFLKLPMYPGGNDAFRNFIQNNMIYPKMALESGIEGIVLTEYEVDDMGKVHNPRVVNGLGYGCDEEAIRLVKLLKYKKVKNRGVRVKSKIKTKIAFNLQSLQLSYSYVENREKPKEEGKVTDSKENLYNYVIKY